MAEGSVRQRSPGSWEVKYDLGRDPQTGKRITKFKTVKGTKRDAQKELRRLLTTVDSGTHVDPGKMTVAEWLGEWLKEAKATVSPTTYERYKIIVDKHLVPALGSHLLAKLAPVHVQAYYSEALVSGRRDGKGGLSAQTVRHHDRALNVAMKRARALRLIASNPVEDTSAPKVERQEIEVLAPEEATALLKTAAGTRLHMPIFVTLATGLRRGEVLALRWSDLDLDRGVMTVAQSLERTEAGLRFKAPKTKRSRRTIALSGSVVEALRAHRARQAAERLQLGLGRDDAALVFPQVTGEPTNPHTFSRRFAELVERAKVRQVTFHALRHTHFTELLRAGVHPKIASERAGHASVSVTMDVYSHAIPGMQEDAAARIDEALRKVLQG